MSGFADSAFCFIQSPKKVAVIGPNPTTSRGCPSVIGVHPKEPRIIFPSGKYIIVRHLEDPSDCFVYRGHAFPTTVAKFSYNGFWVASADVSGKLRVWAWDNPEHILKIQIAVFAGEIKDLEWDPESKRIIAVGQGSEMMAKVFTWDTGNTVGEVSGHIKCILSVSFRPIRPFRIMSGGEDLKTIFFAGPPYKLDHSNTVHTNYVNCVKFSPNGLVIVSVGSDKKIQFYEGLTGQPTTAIPDAHTGSIYSAAWSKDSAQVVTSGADKVVKLWDVASLTCLQTFHFSPDPQLGDMQVSVLWTPSHLLSVSLSGSVNYLSPETPSEPIRVVQAHQGSITAMHYDHPSGLLYTGSFDGVICVRSLPTSTSTWDPNYCHRLTGPDKKSVCGAVHSGKVTGLAVSNGVLASVGWDDNLRLSDATTHLTTQNIGLVGQPCGIATASGDSGIVAVATLKELGLFRGVTKVLSIDRLEYEPVCIAILDDLELAVGGNDNKTHIYAIGSGISSLTEVTSIPTRAAITAVGYSPLKDLLAIGDSGRQVEVYERPSWSPRIKDKWAAHTSRVNCLAWSPNGAFLATGSLDESIIVWSLANPSTQIQIPFCHVSGVTGLAWTADDKLVSTGNDHCIVLWKDVITP